MFSSFTIPSWGLFIHAHILSLDQITLATTTYSGHIPIYPGLFWLWEMSLALDGAGPPSPAWSWAVLPLHQPGGPQRMGIAAILSPDGLLSRRNLQAQP